MLWYFFCVDYTTIRSKSYMCWHELRYWPMIGHQKIILVTTHRQIPSKSSSNSFSIKLGILVFWKKKLKVTLQLFGDWLCQIWRLDKWRVKPCIYAKVRKTWHQCFCATERLLPRAVVKVPTWLLHDVAVTHHPVAGWMQSSATMDSLLTSWRLAISCRWRWWGIAMTWDEDKEKPHELAVARERKKHGQRVCP